MNGDRRSTTRRVAAALVTAGTCGTLLVPPLTAPDNILNSAPSNASNAAPNAAARGHDTSSATARTGSREEATRESRRAPGGESGRSAGGESGRDTSGFRHPCASASTRCDGEIRVPLDRGDPASERITVAFAFLPRKDVSRPATGTVLANPGGPSPALPAVPALTEALGPVLDRHDLLVVEPRGLGRSSPLLCPGLDLEHRETVGACAAHLGPRSRFFTADQAVADMDAVRAALGVPKVTFYGISYGTLFAQAYAARHPGSLSGVLLDSMVRTGQDGYVTGPIRSRTDLLDVACAPSRACRRLPGDPSGLVSRLVRHLRAHPDPQVRLPSLAHLTHNVHLPTVGREASAAVAAYLDGDPLPLRRLARVIDTMPSQPLRGAELAGLLAYVCADTRFPFERAAPADERRFQLNRYYDGERPFRPFTVADLAVPAPGRSILGMQDVCADWPTPRASPPVPPGAEYPRVPVLALGGDFDSTTPAEAAAVTRRFPGSTFSRVRFAGHNLTTGARVNACVRDAMRAFLTDPAAFDDRPRCDEANYRALGSFPGTAARVPPARGGGLTAKERRIVAAAFATVADATAGRNPLGSPFWVPATRAGLRGGLLTYDDEAATVHLRDVRFVGDLAVSGEIRLGVGATADLTVTGGDGAHAMELSWRPFLAEDDTVVSGTLAGRGFTTTVPSH